MRPFRILLTLSLFCFTTTAFAQNTRISDRNTIGWLAGFGTYKLSDRWSIHGEYQWRRTDFLNDWQQSLLRVGINYQLHPKVQLRVGYAWAETFPYGEFPLNALGRDFTEHRAYQMVTLTDKPGRLELAHRFLLEQRWVGKYTLAELPKEDEFVYLNRLRYMLRLQYPLQGNTLDDKEFYLAAYDEVLIGFGKNVAENVFDQNRVGLLGGFRLSKRFRVEAGYLYQIAQLSREVVLPGESAGRNVFQHNTGLVVNSYFNLGGGK